MKSASTETSGKLVGKDFILIAIFGVLIFLIFLLFAGIVWMFVEARVPKRWATLIMCVLLALVGQLLGMLWTGPLGIVIGGLVAEAVMSAQKRSKASVIVGFALWVLCFWVGQQSMIFLAGDSYVDMVVQSGMSQEYGKTLVGFMYGPVVWIAGVWSFVGGVIGGLLGTNVFKKHFERISA